MINFKLDPKAGAPFYRQIIDQIKFGIASGNLKIGEQLPTVRALAVDLKVNLNTVAKAYKELEIQNVLETQQGTGTFISKIEIQISTKKRKEINIIDTSAFEITSMLKVRKNNFSPPPKIDFTVLKIIKKNNLSKELIQTINKIFSYRRKTVKNILKQFDKESKIDKRVDDLSGDEIINLANQILEK